jgi:dihydrofolate reductase
VNPAPDPKYPPVRRTDMSKLIISVATTLDGVIDGFEWFVSQGGHDRAALDQLAGSRAMLVGRKSYEGFAGYWPAQEGPWADVINPMPKYVASRTLSEPLEWNARLLEGELGDAVRRLKDELDGDVFASGCGELARNLLREGVVDEVLFWVHFVVWGDGTRPFEGETVRMRLIGSEAFDSGVTLLRYEPLPIEP